VQGRVGYGVLWFAESGPLQPTVSLARRSGLLGRLTRLLPGTVVCVSPCASRL